MRSKLLLTLVLISIMFIPTLAQDAPPPPELTGDIVATGLNSPQGLFVASDGTLWIADSGLGGDEEIEFINPNTLQTQTASFGMTSRIMYLTDTGEQEVVAQLPSVAVGQDLIGTARILEVDGNLYATVGTWQSALGDDTSIPNQAQLVRIEEGEIITVADLWAHELANNPDESTNVESHPYGMAVDADGMVLVADAAANAVWRINPETGEVETVAAFDGLQGVFPSEFYGGEPITDPVPTAVTLNEDGTMYVSFLSGAPFIPGSAKVVQIDAEGNVSDYATGFTMLTDMQLGADGNLYVLSFGMFTEEGPVFNSGYVARILEDGSAEILIEGLPFATALALDGDGNGYVAINGLGIPEAGMVVYYEGLTDMEGTAMPMMEMDS